MTSAEVAMISTGELEAVDPSNREVAVTRYLEGARQQLAVAVEMSGPAAVAAIKAEIATAAEATKQLGLSKEIQADAQEMVRRAEYALGKAIRAGQAAGDIRSVADTRAPGVNVRDRVHEKDSIVSPKTFFPEGNQTMTEAYAMADNATPEQFEEALSEAREEGNLSRANVVRKIKGEPKPQASERHELLRKTHRIRAERVVAETVSTLEGLVIGLDLLTKSDFDSLDPRDAGQWAESMRNAIKAINKTVKELDRAHAL